MVRTEKDTLYQTWSADGGATWSALTLTALPNPDSGIAFTKGMRLVLTATGLVANSPIRTLTWPDGDSAIKSIHSVGEENEFQR